MACPLITELAAQSAGIFKGIYMSLISCKFQVSASCFSVITKKQVSFETHNML